MNLLAIDTSTNIATVSLQKGEKIFSKSINDTKTHSQKLLPLISEILKENNLTTSDIDTFICGNGPGSFTGIRIGVSTIKAMAQVENKNIFGVSTLDALLYDVIEDSNYICSLIDAKHDNAYYCIAKVNEDKTIKYITDYSIKNINDIIQELNNLNEYVTIIGSNSEIYKEKLSNNKFNLKLSSEVKADNLIKMYNINRKNNAKFVEKNTYTCHSFKPIYLRPSQAERLKQEK